MELTEKNGQASMEEILASIRRIIAEEPAGTHALIDLNGPQRQMRGDGLLDDPSDFDLPSMFRAPAPSSQERATPLFGRLSEAIRAASSSTHTSDHGRAEPSLSSLRLHRNDPVPAHEENGHGAGPAFLLSTFHETTGARPEDAAPADAHMTQTSVQEVEAALAASRMIEAAPEVPRQMAAFKDTRFRGMGSAPQAIEPAPLWPSAFGTPAAASPAVEPVEAQPEPVAAPAMAFATEPHVQAASPAYPAFEAPEPAFAQTPAAPSAPLSLTPPPAPPALPVDAASHHHEDPAGGTADTFKGAPIEDATADLLRPMLRQWLADNMPRMVEKALHIEVAESVKSPKK